MQNKKLSAGSIGQSKIQNLRIVDFFDASALGNADAF